LRISVPFLPASHRSSTTDVTVPDYTPQVSFGTPRRARTPRDVQALKQTRRGTVGR
jgi:hypothetical protein